jgi:hypothetical protein
MNANEYQKGQEHGNSNRLLRPENYDIAALKSKQ